MVTLRGTVEWAYQRDAAARSVNLVHGIDRVTHLITVEPSATLAADLGHRIDEAIESTGDLDGRSIGVRASDATVYLQGTVRSLPEREIAEHVAAGAPGSRTSTTSLR